MARKITERRNADVSVAIIGAGIGGVAAALFLHRAGFDVDLYDQAPEFAEVGGAVGIDSYTVSVLDDWGAADAVMESAGPSCDQMELRSMSGELLRSFTMLDLTEIGVEVTGRSGPREGFGLLRSDLHGKMLSGFPVERTHPRMRLKSVADRGTHAEATFEDGTVIKPRVLIGADGIRSTVRRLFTDVEATPAQVTICRSLASAEMLPKDWPIDRARRWEHAIADGGSINALMGPVRRGTQIAIDTSLYLGDQLLDLEDNLVPLDRLLSLYPAGTDPVLLNALRAGLVETRAYPLFDLPEITTWSSDCVALLGDAAHAMRPLLGQGANQAIQDADELTRALTREPDVSTALKEYERVREPFTNAIKRAAREFRPQYAKVFKAPSQE